MSDALTRPTDLQPEPKNKGGLYEHYCEHPGCTKWGGFGFGRPKQVMHWMCEDHRDDLEQFR